MPIPHDLLASAMADAGGRRRTPVAACAGTTPWGLLRVLGAAACLAGCATGAQRDPADPLEPLNRVTWRVNDALDRTIAQPAARTWNRAVPRPLRTGVDNFFANLGDVTVMVNDFAQLRFEDGMSDLMRVAVNSTFGLLGVLDVATPAGIARHDQDFGLTLGHYGVPGGPYLVLPLFGPSSLRDAAGFGVDQAVAPANRARPRVRNSLWVTDFVSTRARYLNATNLLEQAALDRYLFVRDADLGRRRSQLEDGKEPALPDYEKPEHPP
ncbi:VacJ family lipoprotein [Massilia forsythiae]|uniref:VacJ family lipoprotein n=1 Tax=Massilia forsythiae TaxID=2728020 RepID=A0A7Z2VZ89_9BURK|nr:VacJ family lipoprotein [Massilia forsythiae]QJE01830.1 VacJ family lipoprotein [Massilia forsythiae]